MSRNATIVASRTVKIADVAASGLEAQALHVPINRLNGLLFSPEHRPLGCPASDQCNQSAFQIMISSLSPASEVPKPPVSLNAEQCRAGRALLGWTLVRLASFADVSEPTLRRFESGDSRYDRFGAAILKALEEAGVEFADVGEPSVRLSRAASEEWRSAIAYRLYREAYRASPEGFGNRLKQLREGMGLSQRRLGKLIGLDQSFIARIEGGKAMHSTTLRKLANAFGMTISEVLR